MDAFKLVYKVVVENRYEKPKQSVLKNALKVATLNKVRLHFMRGIGLKGDDRNLEEIRMWRMVKLVGKIAETLKDLDRWCFFKLIKPVVYVPSDVDLLVDRDLVSQVVSRIKKLGFYVEIVEPYCVTLRRGWAVVDIYVQPTLGGLVYLDARKLLGFMNIASYHGIEIPTLETYVEALVNIAHAIYKERIYTLNDYVTVKRWFSKRSLELARMLKCLPAVSFALRVHEEVERWKITLPYKVPIPLWIEMLVSKVVYDRVARATSRNMFKALRDRRIGKHVMTKLMRITY